MDPIRRYRNLVTPIAILFILSYIGLLALAASAVYAKSVWLWLGIAALGAPTGLIGVGMLIFAEIANRVSPSRDDDEDPEP